MSKLKGPVKKIINALLTVLCMILCAFISVAAYSKITGKTVIPYSVLWVLTDSMEDTIPAKSYILVKKIDPSDVKIGDIITFRSREEAIRGNLNTHRVVEIVGDNEEFVTKGDNSKFGVDSMHVLPEDVVAVYVRNMPVFTFFGRVFASTAGFIVCMVLMLAVTALWFYRSFLQKREKLSQEEFDRLVSEEVARLEAQDKKALKNDVNERDL